MDGMTTDVLLPRTMRKLSLVVPVFNEAKAIDRFIVEMADILELMQRAHALSYPADYLLRAQHNRCLPQGGKLWPATLAAAPLGEIEFILPARYQPARAARAPDPACTYRRLARWQGRTDVGELCLIAHENGVC
jgi:hypothetical protein